MEICIFSFTGFSSLNGSNLRVFHLCRELAKRGHEVRFVAPSEKDAESCRTRLGAEAESVGLDIDRFSKSRLKRYPMFAVRASKKAGDADMLFGQSLPSALAVRRAPAGPKKAIDYVDLWSEYWAYANPGLKGRLVYKAVRKGESYSMKADKIFTITNELKAMLEGRGADPKAISIVRDGVDTEMFRPMRPQESFLDKYGLERGVDYIAYQGGIAAHDGVQFLVDAAPLVLKEIPEAKFLIIGNGEYLPRIRRMVKDRGLQDKFIFTGWVPYEDMPHFMNAARINVVPIPDAPATRGVVTLKLFEAMACATPTIIGNLPGARETVEHGKNAYLSVPEDNMKLARGIVQLLKDKRLYNHISANGLELAPDHDWRLIAREMADDMEALT